MHAETPDKLYRKVAADPGDFKGSREKFEGWWENMQLWLMGYSTLTNAAKIIAIITRIKGKGEEWAKAKRTSIINEETTSYSAFKKELLEHFEDHTKKQKAENEIHNFKQD